MNGQVDRNSEEREIGKNSIMSISRKCTYLLFIINHFYKVTSIQRQDILTPIDNHLTYYFNS